MDGKKPVAPSSSMQPGFSVSKSLPLIFFFAIVVLLAYALFVVLSGGSITPVKPAVDSVAPLVPGCADGATRPCELAGCAGLTTCIDGRWAGCQFNFVCRPGASVTCSNEGCAYGIKRCNDCGTGYGPCVPYPPNPQNSGNLSN